MCLTNAMVLCMKVETESPAYFIRKNEFKCLLINCIILHKYCVS